MQPKYIKKGLQLFNMANVMKDNAFPSMHPIITNFIANTPSHRLGCAIDLSFESWKTFVFKKTNPFLFMKPNLITLGLEFANNLASTLGRIFVLIEDDHFHIMLLNEDTIPLLTTVEQYSYSDLVTYGCQRKLGYNDSEDISYLKSGFPLKDLPSRRRFYDIQ